MGENDDNEDDKISEDETEDSFQPGPRGNKYMEIHKTVKLLEGPTALLNEIPKGRKDGLYFIIDNSESIER